MTAHLTAERRWECPNCTHTDVTHDHRPNITRMHDCKGMKLMSMPMVAAGVRCKVELEERQDYVAGELVRTDAEGGVHMSSRVTMDETEHVFVYAPTATVSTERD